MVSGLLVPIIGALFWRKGSAVAAFWSMILGGGSTLLLVIADFDMPMGLDPNVYGICLSAASFIALSFIYPDQKGLEILKS